MIETILQGKEGFTMDKCPKMGVNAYVTCAGIFEAVRYRKNNSYSSFMLADTYHLKACRLSA